MEPQSHDGTRAGGVMGQCMGAWHRLCKPVCDTIFADSQNPAIFIYVHVCTALSVDVPCVVPLVPMRGVCALHLCVPDHGTHDSLHKVSKSTHTAPTLTWQPATCSCGCAVPQGQHAVGTGTRQLPWLGTRSHRGSQSLGPGGWPLLGGKANR